ncbi:hypothetical protein FOA52_006551, partial [Chlamydomonas sp. UWO 241]
MSGANIPGSDEANRDDVTLTTDWKEWCLKCLWSPTAQPKPAGILEYADRAIMTAVGETRPTDYGACAFLANQSYSIEAGIIDPVGIRETCVWKADEFQLRTDADITTPAPHALFTNTDSAGKYIATPLGVAGCLTCMGATHEYKGMGGPQPENTTKAYARALCRHPNWITGVTEAAAPAMADECFACLEDAKVHNACGCNYCYEANFLAIKEGRDVINTTACTKCMMDKPFKDKVGSCSWACAECANITDPTIKQICIDCIMTPAIDAGYPTVSDNEAVAYDLKLGSTEWVGNASEIVCLCVDMAKASTWGGSLSDWYTSLCPDCTAMQRTCYKRRNISLSALNTIVAPLGKFLAIQADAPVPHGYRYLKCGNTLNDDQ